MQWMFFEQHSLEPNIGAAYFWLALIKGGRDLQQHALEDWMENGYRALGVMEMHLASHRFFVGNRYTIADIALYAYTHLAHRMRLRPRPLSRRCAPGSTASPPNPAMWRWTGSRSRWTPRSEPRTCSPFVNHRHENAAVPFRLCRSADPTPPALRATWPNRNPICLQVSSCTEHFDTGFQAPASATLGNERRTLAFAELVATAALMFGIVVACIVVSAGFARADVVGAVIDNESGLFAMALVLGLVIFVGLGTMTLTNRRPRH